jgi:hypothetical protein
MGCGCVNQTPFESILDLFWNGILIRNKSLRDIVDLIRTKKKGTSNIDKKKLDLFIEVLLINPDYKEISYKLFNNSLNEARKKNNEGLFFLSLLFLGKGNETELTKNFLSIAMTQGGLKNSILINLNNSKNLIKKESLYELISFYVNMISLMNVEILSDINDNKEIFIQELNNKFCLENQKQFIDNKIFENYQNDEDIEIESFIIDKFTILINDTYIRQWIYQIITPNQNSLAN